MIFFWSQVLPQCVFLMCNHNVVENEVFEDLVVRVVEVDYRTRSEVEDLVQVETYQVEAAHRAVGLGKDAIGRQLELLHTRWRNQ